MLGTNDSLAANASLAGYHNGNTVRQSINFILDEFMPSLMFVVAKCVDVQVWV